MILFVKKHNTTEEGKVEFEFLTRSPFTNKMFTLDKLTFNEIFRFSENNITQTNISNEKKDVYECLDKEVLNKLLWWNYNITKITPHYENVYESDDPSTKSFRFLESYKSDYREEFGVDSFVFSKDFKFHRSLFNSAVEIVKEPDEYEEAV